MSSSLTFSRNWRKHKVEQKALDLPEYTQFSANANSTSAKLEKNNNQVVQNWREQKVKQNVLDLPLKVLRILKTWMDYCVDLERSYEHLNLTANLS